ncbi:TetR/AcrR family transcriptional regulator [Oxalicibacterium faecigallinarum]|uniref:TetR family transcriptional regulator n=1 Tax=Oxalicibacterium faecigallinarum TaxID=573741 RepID=A0A8J3ALV0_9BURK|nr:TetR-like C-terminal domain-containing protein [Oxalicibacterium faecigallinarum]GGI16843.1 TetR family transcriptional regulator [Oxalicibacterium faecigallinarum]
MSAVNKPKEPNKRETFRHGNLRRALLEAGVKLAREGGPTAVVLREATRQVGVVPNAAYRHFADRDALLLAVCAAAQAELALAIEREWNACKKRRDKAAMARDHLRAVGTGYLRFARQQPGLFRTAFSVHEDLERAGIPEMAGNSGKTPFQLLGLALDEMLEAGVLPADKRPAAEFLAWSSVHGLAMLLIDGPLRVMSDAQAEMVGQRLIDMVERGLP